MKIMLKKMVGILGQPRWFYTICIALFFYAVVCYARIKATDVPTFHLDGAFQTASSLFRLWRGELPGRDFFPYLGIGPIGLIYPLFVLAGANLCASVLASYVVVYGANVISIAVIIHLCWKPRFFLWSLMIACALYSVPQLLILDSSPFFLALQIPEVVSVSMGPGNSLRPLRAFIPYLAIFSVYLFVIKETSQYKKLFYYSLILGVTSLWSNDYAIITMLAVFLISIVSFCSIKNKNVIKPIVLVVLASMAAIAIFQLLATGGYALNFIKYNFLDVANDQWWYFGIWLAPARIFVLNDLPKFINEIRDPISFYILGSSFISIFIFWKRRLELFLLFIIGLLLFLGGAVASIGGHIDRAYFLTFLFWSRLFVVIGCSRLILVFIPNQWVEGSRRITHAISIAICFLVVATYAVYAHQLWIHFEKAKINTEEFYIPELGGYLHKGWAEYIAYIRANKEQTTVEEYSGIWSAMLKKPSIWPVDSSIHALGSVRKIAEKALRDKADIVVTSAPNVSFDWFGWNVSANYWLYKPLFESYTPAFYSPTTIVWKKDKPRAGAKNIACKVAETKNRILVDAPHAGYYEVALTTTTKQLQKNRYLKMFENNINYALFEIGEVSLSPEDEAPILPIYIAQKGENTFGFTIRPENSAHVIIESCSVKEILLKNDRILMMSNDPERMYNDKYDPKTFYHDPSLWTRGIANNVAGFYIYKDKKALNDFKIGNEVELPTGEKRTIISLAGVMMYLEVYLSGDKLDPSKVGLPTKFKGIERKDTNVVIPLSEESFFLTDNNWVNGVAIRWAGFFTHNTDENRKLYAVGNSVRIPNTSDRVITKVIPSGVYLEVYLTGDPMDGTKVGLPDKFKLLEDKK